MEALNKIDLTQKAMLICLYNDQKATPKQIERVLKAYSTHEYLDRFLVPRWEIIKNFLG